MTRLALRIDLDRCIGCKSCEAACKQEHGLGPHEYRNKVLWMETPGKPAVDLLTVTCQHCERPACLRACPVHPKAIVKDPVTGVVAVDESRCTGCGECVMACPYGAMGFDPVDHHAVKCDLCADRRGRGEAPACASVCPGHAIEFGPRDALVAAAQADGRSPLDHDHYLLGPATVYLEAPVSAARPARSDASRVVALIGDHRTRRTLDTAELAAPYGLSRAERTPDRVVPGGCNICFNGCPVRFSLRGNQVVGVSGNPDDPVFQGRICPKSQMTLQLYNNERRLTQPLKRVGPGRFEPIGWDQALDEIAARLRTVRDQHGPEALAIFSGTRAGMITNSGYVRLFAQMWGTPNVESTEPLCSSAKNLAFSLVQGDRVLANSYTPTDIGSAGLFVYIGDNQAETRPVYFGMINEWRRRTGARLIAIDPRMSTTATKADVWLAIRSGTDMALGLALIHHIVSHDLHDAGFCADWVEGFERWRAFVLEKDYSPAWAAAITDLPAARIARLAEEIAAADGTMIFNSRGINQHTNATQTVRVFMFLAAITGNWGRPGGGYFNISTTTPISAAAPPERRAAIKRPAAAASPGGWLRAMTTGEPYPIRALLSGNNPFAHWPGQTQVRAAAETLDLFVQTALFWNATCELADYVLPVATGVERGGITRGAEERRIVWNDPLIEPPGAAKPDGWIWVELGKRFGFDDVLRESYKDVATFWDEMCIDNDALRGCTVARFRRSPTRTLRTPAASEDAPDIETLYVDASRPNRFPTPSGKLEFWTEAQAGTFAAVGLDALPTFYSEREQLIDLPHLVATEEPGIVHEVAGRRVHRQRVRIETPPPGHSEGARLRALGFDTELVTGRPPAPHFHAWTHDFWQAQEMWPDLYVQIHPDKARAIGVADGERVRVATEHDWIDARAWVRDGIRPSCVFVPIGWEERQPYHPWRPVNFLTDPDQRDPMAEQTNLKTRLCRVSAAPPG